MASVVIIAQILSDRGYGVSVSRGRGRNMADTDGDILFTGEYARFLCNPNLYYFRDDDTAAADFIDDGIRTLAWTKDDIQSSLECDKDQLYFTCQMYQKISQKEIVTSEESHSLYCLFKESVEKLLYEYCKDFGLQYKSFSFYLGRRADGKCSQDNVLQSAAPMTSTSNVFLTMICSGRKD